MNFHILLMQTTFQPVYLKIKGNYVMLSRTVIVFVPCRVSMNDLVMLLTSDNRNWAENKRCCVFHMVVIFFILAPSGKSDRFDINMGHSITDQLVFYELKVHC
jgi:hypothetical protein